MAATISAGRDSRGRKVGLIPDGHGLFFCFCFLKTNEKSESKQTHLDDLCNAIREFARGEGLEERGVDEDVLGLPERADEVLAVRRVDRGLSAHARVDHRE